MKIRNADNNDLESIHKIEAICFPPNQAASLINLHERLQIFPEHFWLIEDNGKIVGFINGMVTNYDTIKDEMFSNPKLHTKDGGWQTVFGLAISPKYQKMGYAGKLLNHISEISIQNHKKGVVLTCEEHLISFYQKFGFVNIGLSSSVHGGDVFFDMRKEF